MRYWFTGDCHFNHSRVIEYANRPFKFLTANNGKIVSSAKKMNDTLIRNWNERVKPGDLVYHLGDFCFKSNNDRGNGGRENAKYWESCLNGKIVFLKGSHDSNNSCKTNIRSIIIYMGGRRINLIHDPKHVDYGCALNFCAHVHQLWDVKRFRQPLFVEDSKPIYQTTDCINVGVDQWGFRPVSFEEIIKRYAKWLLKKGLNQP